MTLVRGSLVGLLCMPVLLVGCGADPGTVGDIADNPGDMLDDSADVGPSQHELELARSITQKYLALTELRSPITALKAFDLRDEFELVGLERELAPNFLAEVDSRTHLPACLDIGGETGSTISLDACQLGGLTVSADLTINFETIDVSLGVGGVLLSYNTGANLFANFGINDHAMSAGVGSGIYFGSLTAGMELGLTDLVNAECGPSAGSFDLIIELGGSQLVVGLPFFDCGG